jgi:hypothetical protein
VRGIQPSWRSDAPRPPCTAGRTPHMGTQPLADDPTSLDNIDDHEERPRRTRQSESLDHRRRLVARSFVGGFAWCLRTSLSHSHSRCPRAYVCLPVDLPNLAVTGRH